MLDRGIDAYSGGRVSVGVSSGSEGVMGDGRDEIG